MGYTYSYSQSDWGTERVLTVSNEAGQIIGQGDPFHRDGIPLTERRRKSQLQRYAQYLIQQHERPTECIVCGTNIRHYETEYLGYYFCDDCAKPIGEHCKAERAAWEAARPRCEVPGCNRPGTLWWGWEPETVLLCGSHARPCKAWQGPSMLFGACRLTRQQILALAMTKLPSRRKALAAWQAEHHS